MRCSMGTFLPVRNCHTHCNFMQIPHCEHNFKKVYSCMSRMCVCSQLSPSIYA